MKNKIKFIVFISITILWMGFIFSMSAKNADQSSNISGSLIYNILNNFEAFESLNEYAKTTIVEDLQFIVRKGAHFTGYAILGGLCFIDTGFILKNKEKLRFIWAFSIGAAYAVSDEIHQYFVPGRSCEIRDMLIDSSGVFVGIILVLFIRFILQKLKKFYINRK